jgi:hypothetical protein
MSETEYLLFVGLGVGVVAYLIYKVLNYRMSVNFYNRLVIKARALGL